MKTGAFVARTIIVAALFAGLFQIELDIRQVELNGELQIQINRALIHRIEVLEARR